MLIEEALYLVNQVLFTRTDVSLKAQQHCFQLGDKNTTSSQGNENSLYSNTERVTQCLFYHPRLLHSELLFRGQFMSNNLHKKTMW